MKFTYKHQHKKIPRLNNISDTMKKIIMATNCPDYVQDISDDDDFDDIIIGGCFIPDDNQTQINLTSEFLIRDNIDKVNANNCYLASFFGDNNPYDNQYNDKVNYIGKWSDNIEANANIYYVIVDNQIRKIIFSKPIDNTLVTDGFGIVYIICDDGNMVYCEPDEGDVLFDNEKEAKRYLTKKNPLLLV